MRSFNAPDAPCVYERKKILALLLALMVLSMDVARHAGAADWNQPCGGWRDKAASTSVN